MKKIFMIAVAAMTSMSMFAAVEFHYLPTTGDSNGDGATFNTSDKVAVAAGFTFIEGSNFTVKNAYATTYKVVGMMTDTAYAALQIGDVTVDYTTQRIQGQDNPTAGGGNPVLDMKAPTAGACFLVEPKTDGYIYVAVKTTLDKQQFVFQGVTENNGQVAGTLVGYDYLTMCNPGKMVGFGNPVDGAVSVRIVGTGAANKLLAPCPMINAAAGTSNKTNGVGVLVFPVKANVKVICGTAGSKMMACGFGFSTEKVEVKAIGSKSIKALKPEWTGEDNYDDVVISEENNFYSFNCDETPILVRVKLPANEYKKSYTAADTANVWVKVTDDGKGGYKLNANVYAWTWGTAKDGSSVDGHWLQAAKSGDYYVLQVDGMQEFGIVLNPNGTWEPEGGHKNYMQTEDIIQIENDICVQVGDVPADQNVKCATILLDCLTGDPLAINNVFENARIEKRIENGQLIMVVDGVRYNVQGARF